MKTKTKAMRPTQKLTPAQRFFFEQAGYSYGQGETPEQGRTRCAITLAAAEAQASAAGVQFRWEPDGMTNREWTDEGNEYGTWACAAFYNGECIGSLCGVDFGDGGKPWGDPYARVVQAEIVSEWSGPDENESEENGDLF